MAKLASLPEIREAVQPGATVVLGGVWLSNHPMAAVREIIRTGVRDLEVMTVVGSIDVDLLIGAGCVRKLVFSFVSLEAFGLPPNFRRAIERSEIEYQEVSGLALLLALEATGRGVPFLPYNGPFGSDYFAIQPDFYRFITCPFTGQELVAVPAIAPDVAMIHAQAADPDGNVWCLGTSGGDVEMAKAAKTTIVTTERLLSAEELRREPWKTKIPRLYVDMVIASPFGAHPTSCVPEYALDAWHLLEYVQAAPDPERFRAFLGKSLGSSEEAYRAQLGEERLSKLQRLMDKVQVL